MWFPYLKSHTVIDIAGGTVTTFANIAATTAAYVAGVFAKNIQGNVLAVDDAAIVTSGADIANSSVACGTITTTSGYGKSKYQDFYKGIAAASADAVHAAITLADGETTEVTTGITDPVHYRAVSVTGNASGIAGNVVIVGTDWAGNAATDTIVAADTDTVVGVQPFKTITSITVPARTQASDTITIGIADVLGLSRPVAASADVLYVGIAADATDASTFTYEDAASVDTTNNTVTLTTSITASDDVTVDFYTTAV